MGIGKRFHVKEINIRKFTDYIQVHGQGRFEVQFKKMAGFPPAWPVATG